MTISDGAPSDEKRTVSFRVDCVRGCYYLNMVTTVERAADTVIFIKNVAGPFDTKEHATAMIDNIVAVKPRPN